MQLEKEKQLENIMENCIVDYIVEKVIEKLIYRNKKALLLFTGATIGFEESIASLKNLKENGWKFEVVLSKSAKEILDTDIVKEISNESTIIFDEDKVNIEELVKRNNLIIMPTLTINTASKISNCISDNIITNIISYSIMIGKTIVVSTNGCCPDNKERIEIFKDNVSQSYKNTLRSNLEKIKSYGLLLTSSKNLYFKVENILIKTFNKEMIENKNDSLKVENNRASIKLNKKIISRSDIYNNKEFKSIVVSSNSLITDMARDEAIKLNIKLLKE